MVIKGCGTPSTQPTQLIPQFCTKTSFSLLLVSRWSVHTCDVGPEAGPEAEEEHQAGAQAGRGGPDGVGVQSLLTQPHHPDQN